MEEDVRQVRKRESRRVNLLIPVKMHEYYKNKSVETGIPMSYLMATDLYEKVKQDHVIAQMPELLEAARKVKL